METLSYRSSAPNCEVYIMRMKEMPVRKQQYAEPAPSTAPRAKYRKPQTFSQSLCLSISSLCLSVFLLTPVSSPWGVCLSLSSSLFSFSFSVCLCLSLSLPLSLSLSLSLSLCPSLSHCFSWAARSCDPPAKNQTSLPTTRLAHKETGMLTHTRTRTQNWQTHNLGWCQCHEEKRLHNKTIRPPRRLNIEYNTRLHNELLRSFLLRAENIKFKSVDLVGLADPAWKGLTVFLSYWFKIQALGFSYRCRSASTNFHPGFLFLTPRGLLCIPALKNADNCTLQ